MISEHLDQMDASFVGLRLPARERISSEFAGAF
jgi:hypothetical protein